MRWYFNGPIVGKAQLTPGPGNLCISPFFPIHEAKKKIQETKFDFWRKQMALGTRSSQALDTVHTDVLSQARLACYKVNSYLFHLSKLNRVELYFFFVPLFNLEDDNFFSFFTKSEWRKARDAFYTCLEEQSNKKPTEIASVGLLYPVECKQSREAYVKQCRPTWVISILSNRLLIFNIDHSNFFFLNFLFGRWSILIGSIARRRGLIGFWMTMSRGEVRCHYRSLLHLNIDFQYIAFDN